MSAPLIPWEPSNIPEELHSELNRRKTNRSFKFVDAMRGEWSSETGEWANYRGPMVPWVRCCSNGKGSEKVNKPGFVLFGGKDFYSGYGFNALEGKPSVIGYVPSNPVDWHTVENDLVTSEHPIHVPSPEIERLQITIQKEHYRRVTMDWVCFSKAQLEYMTPYFLVPGISCILEWGWNHYDPRSLLDLTNTAELAQRFHNPYPLYTKHILGSKGNYDVLFGIITHFEWQVEGNKIKCKTEITSKDRIYSGLVIDSSIKRKSGDDEEVDSTEIPLGAITTFIDKNVSQFKNLTANKDPESIPELAELIRYIKNRRMNWKEYVFGVFYGRDLEDKKSPLQQGADTKKDFDYANGKNAELWLNLGLVMEIINFHSSPLKGMGNEEMFSVDIDDVVVGGHPNLISTDGRICLIPNAEAPKYFWGREGQYAMAKAGGNEADFIKKLKPHTNALVKIGSKADAAKTNKLADWKLKDLCRQYDGAFRDDLDEIINRLRYENKDVGGQQNGTISFEFPFIYDRQLVKNSKPYPARYSGYLKHIYVSWSFIKELLAKSDTVKTYPRLIEKILEGVNASCGNFWDFRLVDATGSDDLKPDEPARMKVVDYKFMYFANRGKVYTFDYMDADSLLLGVGFKPTLSNAQAIRTIYAQTNHPDKVTTLTNGTNELLDYHFKDRLFEAQDKKTKTPSAEPSSREAFKDALRALQQIEPPSGAYQITNKQGNETFVRRLVLPNIEVLNMLLDDGDDENNPKYTGIMPGIQANFTIQGIGGLRTFMMFLVRNLPEPYSHKNIIFRIVDVQESVEAGKWVTTITAGVIPLRGYIKKRLGIQD
jgi:hypothetical protein